MRAAVVPSAEDHRLELRDVTVPEPGPGQVRIKVEACGICHSDVLTVLNLMQGTSYPRVPGHEIAGTIDAVGSADQRLECGRSRRRRLVRRLRRHLRSLPPRRLHDVPQPADPRNRLRRRLRAVRRRAGHRAGAYPNELTAVEAAPLMCAGITTFNPLRRSAARAGDLVAVLGIGGLGHLGVQFAAKMGFNTVAIARGRDKEQLARQLGAAHYIDSSAADVATELQRLGGAKVVLSTITSGAAMEPALGGLGVDGQLLIVGASNEPLPVDTLALMGRRGSIKVWPSGTSSDSEDTMRFAVQSGVRAMTEVVPLERAAEGFQRMMSGAARFRMVLDIAKAD